jgi:hypothetical protein
MPILLEARPVPTSVGGYRSSNPKIEPPCRDLLHTPNQPPFKRLLSHRPHRSFPFVRTRLLNWTECVLMYPGARARVGYDLGALTEFEFDNGFESRLGMFYAGSTGPRSAITQPRRPSGT